MDFHNFIKYLFMQGAVDGLSMIAPDTPISRPYVENSRSRLTILPMPDNLNTIRTRLQQLPGNTQTQMLDLCNYFAKHPNLIDGTLQFLVSLASSCSSPVSLPRPLDISPNAFNVQPRNMIPNETPTRPEPRMTAVRSASWKK